ncbi:MAG: pitrilysin family protein [Candidatus Wallbacteria bacterium]
MLKRAVLDNKITLVMENTSSVRSICIGVWVHAGAIYEKPAINGISHFLEHMMFKGTKTRTAREIAEIMDSVGGQLNAFSAKEFTCYFAKVRDEHAELGIELISDMLKNSTFDESEIEREKNVVMEEIKMYEDAPDELIHDMFSQSLWQNHPIGAPILGTNESVSGLNREKIMKYYNEKYSPENYLITIVGNFKIPKIISLVKKYFKYDKDSVEKKAIKIQPPKHTIKHEIREKNVEQVHIVLGTPGITEIDESRYQLYVLNSILGGSMSSRLFQEIRENRGLAYSIFSYASLYKIAGLFGVYAGCSYKDCDNVVKLIIAELGKMTKKKISGAELSRAKELLKGNMILSLEGTNARMNRLARNEIYFERQITIDEVLEKINAVTENDIMELSRKLFNPKNMALSIIGPAGDKDKKLHECVNILKNS